MLNEFDLDLRAREFNEINAFKHPIIWIKAIRPFQHNWIDELSLTSKYFKIKHLKRDVEDSILLLAGVTVITALILFI